MEKEEKVLLHIERDPLFLLTSVLISGGIVFAGYQLLKAVNPWGFIVLIPGGIFSFQTVWWLLNPFGLVFADKIEIKQSLLHHRYRYFVDLKKVSVSKKGKLIVTYTDDNMEAMNLFGIKAAHLMLLKTEMEKSISAHLQTRALAEEPSGV